MNIHKLFFIFTTVFLTFFSCGLKNNDTSSSLDQNQKVPDEKTIDGYYIITAEIVKKKFQNKIGAETEIEEWYVRRSIQDYFIKFCEGDIDLKDLENAIEEKEGSIKILTLKVDFRNGYWDSCEPDSLAQSRLGDYVIIQEILPISH